ncbi:MAG: response regulator [Betaproteobacteria bacterium]|nr:MAG: response regulator [Euryarchaeota archaeon]TMH48471.1 MAG: response regulator [Betaproteobacteria bacterium]
MVRRILIVDDEPNIVTLLEFLMRGSDYEVRVARNGEEALRRAESFRPDLVLLDVMMPQRSGFEVCQKIRENPALRDVKIVMLTAKGRDLEKDRGLNLGANAYVTKPFSTKELMNTVRGLLPDSE